MKMMTKSLGNKTINNLTINPTVLTNLLMYNGEYKSSDHYKHFYLILTEYAKNSLLVLADDIHSPFIRK
jgi:hypothetical protein